MPPVLLRDIPANEILLFSNCPSKNAFTPLLPAIWAVTLHEVLTVNEPDVRLIGGILVVDV
jgi:hypothetical protein